MNNNSSKVNTITMDVIRDCSPHERPKLSKVSERHPKSLLDQINQLRKSDELCDVILRVGSLGIKAHKIILSASSPYFKAMFTTNLCESKQNEITIRDINENAIEQLVDFCYTSKITVDDKNVQNILPAACLLQMQEVQDYCSEFLRSQLDPTNCLGIRAFADTHSCKELLKVADKYLQNNFADVVTSDEFLLLPLNQLLEIISSDELNVKSEENVFKAVMNWIKHDLNERKQYLGQLMSHVRLPLLDVKYLVTQVSSDPLVRTLSISDQTIRDLIDEAKDYHLLPQDRSLNQSIRTKPRKPFILIELLFAIGGWCSGDAISSVEMLDPLTSNEWKVVSSMGKRRCGVGVGVLNQQIYAIGGHDGISYLNSVERFCPITNKWYNDIAPTSNCRTSVGVCCLDGALYAIGGQDGVSCLNVVERYDPNLNRWSRAASMNSRRLGVSVVVLNNFIFAIGGSDGSSPLNTVERYDPKNNRWTFMSPMITKRKHLGCAIYNDFIYAVGGRDDLTELNSVERYNPHTNQWFPCQPMKSRRSGVGLAVVNNQLLAVGGFDGSSYLKTVEIYDNERNVWKLNSSMIYRRLGGGVAVLKIQREQLFSKSPEIDQLNINLNTSQSINHQQQQPSPNSLISTPSNNFHAQSSNNTNTFSFVLNPIPPLNSLIANSVITSQTTLQPSANRAVIISQDSILSDISNINEAQNSTSPTLHISNSSSRVSPSSMDDNLNNNLSSNETTISSANSNSNIIKLVDV